MTKKMTQRNSKRDDKDTRYMVNKVKMRDFKRDDKDSSKIRLR